MLGAWVWDFSPVVFSIFGRDLRWYGLLFASGFLAFNYLMHYVYRKEERDMAKLDNMLLYAVAGIVLGARFGHVLFYDPVYYLTNPLEILKIWKGGLASHGALIGAFIASIIYARKTKQSLRMLVDRALILTLLGGSLVRLGNFANSEVYGKKSTNSLTSVVFVQDVNNYLERSFGSRNLSFKAAKSPKNAAPIAAGLLPISLKVRYKRAIDSTYISNVLHEKLPSIFNAPHVKKHLRLTEDFRIHVEKHNTHTDVKIALLGVPRHPTQLYEALFYMILFALLFIWWKKTRTRPPPDGHFFGIGMIALWMFRFFIEFLKEPQAHFNNTLALNVGQLLSIPAMLAGAGALIYVWRKASISSNK